MAKQKTDNAKRVISARVPDYIYNVVMQYKIDHDCTTSRAVEEILAGGINFLMMMDDNESE